MGGRRPPLRQAPKSKDIRKYYKIVKKWPEKIRLKIQNWLRMAWNQKKGGGVQWRVARKIYFRDTEVPSEARKVKIGTEVNIC